MSRIGPCMCGAPDCPSCGPAQGYRVVRVPYKGGYRWVNPDEDEENSDEDDGEEEES